jgi:hypothetical protein
VAPAPRRALVVAAVLFASGLCACRDAPDVVFDSARAALADRDPDAFLALCEPGARALIERGEVVNKRSARIFKVLADGKPTAALLPKGDVSEVIESGHRAVVKIKRGDAVSIVPMRLVRGHWKIDLMEMDAFYEALEPR